MIEGFKYIFLDEVKDLDENTRVRVVGYVIDKYIAKEKNYGYLEIIDDTGYRIRVKFFGNDVYKIENINLYDVVDVLGVVRVWKDEKYVKGRYVFKRDDFFLIYWYINIFYLRNRDRKKELKKEEIKQEIGYKEVEKSPEKEEIEFKPASELINEEFKEEIPVEVVTIYNGLELEKKVYEYIVQHPECTIEEISNALKIEKKEAEEIIKELMIKGEIYEPSPGKYKAV